MYGWINGCLEDWVLKSYGDETWRKIRELAKCDIPQGCFYRSMDFPDEITYQLIDAASKVLCISTSNLYETFGRNFVHFAEKHGYGSTLRSQGDSMREWLINIDEPHRMFSLRFPKCVFPAFWTEHDDEFCESRSGVDGSLILHYASARVGGLASVVEGIVKEAGSVLFQRTVHMEMLGSEILPNGGKFHCWWRITNCGKALIIEKPLSRPSSQNFSISSDTSKSAKCPFSRCFWSDEENPESSKPSVFSSGSFRSERKSPSIGINCDVFKRVFPFHIVVDENLQVMQLGAKIHELVNKDWMIPDVLNHHIGDHFTISLPVGFAWDWNALKRLESVAFELTLRDTLTSPAGEIQDLKFHGQFEYIDQNIDGVSKKYGAFFVNPNVLNMVELANLSIKPHDLPRHSFQANMLLMSDHLLAETNLAVKLEQIRKCLDKESSRTKDALTTKRIFVRYVSHEIRTPLNISILGLRCLEQELQSLSLSYSERSAVSSVVEEVKASCLTAVDIINDLLLYEKVDNGIFDMNFQMVHDIPSWLEDSTKLFHVQAKGANVNLSTNITSTTSTFQAQSLSCPSASSGGVPHDGLTSLESACSSLCDSSPLTAIAVEVDQSKFQQVLRNLFVNAVKFTPAGGIVQLTYTLHGVSSFPSGIDDTDIEPLSSLVAMRSFNECDIVFAEEVVDFPSRYLRIQVRDSGAGISCSDQRTLFHEFSQVKADKLQQGQGSGLGLWIAATIVKMHKGRIGVYSAGEGHGATFLVDLPLIESRHEHDLVDLNADEDSVQRQQIDLAGDIELDLLSSDSADHIHHNDNSPYWDKQSQLLQSMDTCSSMSQITPSAQAHFSFTFSPFTSPESSQKIKRSAPQRHAFVPTLLRDVRLLIVDDAATNRKMVRRLLSKLFVQIDEAENGLAAVDKYAASLQLPRTETLQHPLQHAEQQLPIMLIMMDFLMPLMNGPEATARIKQLASEHNRRVIVVGVTGNGLQDGIDVFLKHGADEVLVKPLNYDYFMTYLERKHHFVSE